MLNNRLGGINPPTTLGTLCLAYVPIIVAPNILEVTVTNNLIFIDNLIVNVIKGHCNFTLTVANRAIVLPCPLWGDQQTFLGSVIFKKTLNNETYSYIKQSALRKLQYVFSVDTQKRIELYNFVNNFSDNDILIYNHKGERWKAQLVNNPFQFDSRVRAEPRREKFDVTLEFEGIRLG